MDKPNINNITHHFLHDKIKVFEMAGEDTKAYDYAIPQPMFDELVKMGIDNPGAWFVADCGGPSAFARLRHVGEAFYAIIHHRSEANKEIFMGLHADTIVNNIIMRFAGNAVCNEADAGMIDLNMVIGLVTEGYSQGRKSMMKLHQEFKCNCGNTSHTDGFFPCNRDGKDIEPTIEAGWDNLYKCARCGLIFDQRDGPQNTIILESKTNPGDEFTPPHSITLCKWGNEQWVTHWKNHQTGGFSHGHYFYDQEQALDNYVERCNRADVKPF